MRTERGKNFIFSALSVVALWLIWIIAYFAVGDDYVLPSAWDTLAQTGKLLTDAEFWRAFAGTLLRAFSAFAFSALAGIVLALAATLFRFVRALLAPVVSVLRTVPTVAVILMLLLWTPRIVAPVIVALLVLFPAVYAAALSELDKIRAEYGELTRVYRVGKARAAFRMYLPLSLRGMLGQAGAIFSLGLKITVSGEVLASTYHSLGGLMQEAKLWDMPTLLALTLLTVLLGFAIEGIFVLIEKTVGGRKCN